MTLVKWNPRNQYLSKVNEWDNFLSEFFSDGWPATTGYQAYEPAVDIKESKDEFNINVDLPGLTKKDISVNIKDNILTITGERTNEKSEGDDNYYRIERRHGSFKRSFKLPELVKEDKINALFKNGVLSISLPKVEEVKPKEIQVKIA